MTVMKNLVNKFLLPLCILLLNGYGHIYAHSAAQSDVSIVGETLQESIDEAQYSHAYISLPSSSTLDQEFIAELIETSEEENHIVHSFKSLEAHNYFSALFYALLFGYLFQNLRGTFHIGEYTPYFSSFSPLYLAFRVIRL